MTRSGGSIQEGRDGGRVRNRVGLALSALLGLLLFLFLPGCSAGGGGFSIAAPAITTFTAEPATIAPGGSAVLTGVFTNGTGVVTPGNTTVTSGQGTTCSPSATTTYALTVTSPGGVSITAQATVTVTAADLPVIGTFSAAPASINAGQSSTLTWSVTGATTVSIDQGLGDVTSNSSLEVSPAATTTYTLTASNPSGSVTAQATVTVTAADVPVIGTFSAAPATITAGQGSTLAWNVTGATAVSIDQGLGDVAGTGSRQVSPAATTTYTLTASNPSGSVTARATVTVTAADVPVIGTFSAVPATITAGQSSTLAWSVTGATTVSIDQGIGPVPASGTRSVSPASTTTYTLTATNSAGSVSRTATVTVATVPLPVIQSFTATPASITKGQTSTLAWSVTNATALSIDHGVGTVTALSSAQVKPPATTTYTLTASNAGGSVTHAVTVTVAPRR